MVRRYARSKYIAVVIITIGISMATIASAHQMVSVPFGQCACAALIVSGCGLM